MKFEKIITSNEKGVLVNVKDFMNFITEEWNISGEILSIHLSKGRRCVLIGFTNKNPVKRLRDGFLSNDARIICQCCYDNILLVNKDEFSKKIGFNGKVEKINLMIKEDDNKLVCAEYVDLLFGQNNLYFFIGEMSYKTNIYYAQLER